MAPLALSPAGMILRRWRAVRQLSQLQLGLAADVSARHISFIETGRSDPSREMVLRLAFALDLPLTELNSLLQAAGYVAVHPRRPLDAAAMVTVRSVLERMLQQHEPYPALVIDSRFTLLQVNGALRRHFAFLGFPLPPPSMTAARPNLLRLLLQPGPLRAAITNWEDLTRTILRRAHREVLTSCNADELRSLLAEVQRWPGVPQDWHRAMPIDEQIPVLTLTLRKDDQQYAFLSTITTFGSPQDLTVQDLRIESLFPTDERSDRLSQRLAAEAGQHEDESG